MRNDASFVDGVDVTIMAIGLSSGLILILIVALTIGFLVNRRSKTEEMAQFLEKNFLAHIMVGGNNIKQEKGKHL